MGWVPKPSPSEGIPAMPTAEATIFILCRVSKIKTLLLKETCGKARNTGEKENNSPIPK